MDTNNPLHKRIEALQAIPRNNKGNDADTQAKRLLIALKTLGSITTLEARQHLDILALAARIFHLRNMEGHEIPLTWEHIFTEVGEKHRIGRYSYLKQLDSKLAQEQEAA